MQKHNGTWRLDFSAYENHSTFKWMLKSVVFEVYTEVRDYVYIFTVLALGHNKWCNFSSPSNNTSDYIQGYTGFFSTFSVWIKFSHHKLYPHISTSRIYCTNILWKIHLDIFFIHRILMGVTIYFYFYL